MLRSQDAACICSSSHPTLHHLWIASRRAQQHGERVTVATSDAIRRGIVIEGSGGDRFKGELHGRNAQNTRDLVSEVPPHLIEREPRGRQLCHVTKLRRKPDNCRAMFVHFASRRYLLCELKSYRQLGVVVEEQEIGVETRSNLGYTQLAKRSLCANGSGALELLRLIARARSTLATRGRRWSHWRGVSSLAVATGASADKQQRKSRRHCRQFLIVR